jgi:hypothetical protein
MGYKREGRGKKDKESIWRIMVKNCLNYRINLEKLKSYEKDI